MATKKDTSGRLDWKEELALDGDWLKELVQEVVELTLEGEMSQFLGADKGERTSERQGYRAGYYPRTLITRVGKLELRVPQDRRGAVLDRAVRALPALGEGAGVGAGGDVRAGGVDPQGEGDHRGAVRPRLLRLGHQRDQQGPG